MMRFLSLLPAIGLTVLPLSAQDTGIPPPSDEPPARIRIPLASVEKAVQQSEDRDEADEIAALALAARAPGYVPPTMGSILRTGMPLRVVLTIQGRVEFSSDAQRINESGRIGLPLINTIEVVNKSLAQVEHEITAAYLEFYRDPLVRVEFVGEAGNPYMSPWGFVTLTGAVRDTGPIAIPPTRNLTVSGAIKLAGGAPETANKGRIRVFRPDPEDKSVERINVDLNDLGSRGRANEDILLQPGDVVYVPERIL